jgi:cyclic pyranopterin phosphate synthase
VADDGGEASPGGLRGACRPSLALLDPPAPVDLLGRPLQALRLSVTDRCNFRCSYCLPPEGLEPRLRFMPPSRILTFEENVRLVRACLPLGVRKVRLTGGEPLLRTGLAELVRALADLPGLTITLTTNGARLAEHAEALAEAGLARVTVSLDSLDDVVFRRMAGVDFPVARVLDGIDAAARAGLRPIKVNAVVRRGVNDDGVVDLARYFRDRGHVLRFIELMDVGTANRWRPEEVVPSAEIVARIGAVLPLEPFWARPAGEVARRMRYADGRGEIGFVTSVTRPFCGDCTRARLSADGMLFTCLFAGGGTDLRGPLRAGATDGELRELVRKAWCARADRYSELRSATVAGSPRVEMSYVGG